MHFLGIGDKSAVPARIPAMRLAVLSSALLLLSFAYGAAASPPAPYGPVPSAAQIAWHDMEMYAFCHFTTNTFTDKEWGYGDEDPAVFNPTDLDVDQIVGTLARCGFKGVILTCKHHDGFCLWPTKATDHNISKSPWKGGKGDMVREFADAAKHAGIGFGVYLSPWDRNNKDYGTPQYVDTYRKQLRELLTQYGPLFEVWYDGANGGDGYYGGKREKRSIDRATYYDWPKTWEIVRKFQPQAVMFSDAGPDVRWVGNENGIAPYPNWATFTPLTADGRPGTAGTCATQLGSPDGKIWMPTETDVSIRPGWFWHAHENDKVRSPKNLLNLYFNSLGHGSSFLLNVPPDRRGRLHENDVAALTGFKQALDRMFSNNLAAGAKASADALRGAGYEPDLVLDGDKQTYWATPDETRAATLDLTLPEARSFSVIRLREPVRLGQRIRKFAVDVRENGAWSEWIGNGSSVGPVVLLRGKPVTADGVRVRILESSACPCLSEVSLWLEPTDVSDNLANSSSKVLPRDGWKISASSERPDHPAAAAIDGKAGTYWSAGKAAPASLTVDLGALHDLAAVTVLPRQDGQADSMVDRYRIEWSADGMTWSAPVEGEFSNLRANPVEQRVTLPAGTRARHIRFTALRVLEGKGVSVAEFGVVEK